MKKLLTFLIPFALLLSKPVSSQPGNIHLSWNSNKERSTEKSIAITWFSNSENSSVKYGRNSSLATVKLIKGKYSPEMKSFVHKAVLTNLKSNKKYFYKCGNDESGWSEIYSFQTAPKLGKDDFTVGVWGDTQDNEFNTRFEKSEMIMNQLLKYPIRFSIHMGDIVDNGSSTDSWNRFFKVTQPLHAIAPFMPVVGNHDVDNSQTAKGFQWPFPVFHDLFNLPEDNVNYSFDYGNTHFVAINSGFAKEVEKSGKLLFAKDSPEYQWLENDLSKARNNPKIKWVIVYMHYPLYSYGWSHVLPWQERITPLMDKYQVDLCLSGHRHVYERHKAIRNNKILPQNDVHTYEKPAGTVYITNGTAGGSPQGLGGAKMPSMVYTSSEKMYNYAIMTVKKNSLDYQVYNQNGERIDYFSLIK